MLLMAIYENWNEVKVSEAAERLSVSRKSASRCFDELEYLNIDVLGMVWAELFEKIWAEKWGYYKFIKENIWMKCSVLFGDL